MAVAVLRNRVQMYPRVEGHGEADRTTLKSGSTRKEGITMMTRFFTFMFASCLVSSFAFADNPADAPLFADDASSVTVQQNCAPHQRMHSGKKVKTPAAPAKRDEAAKADPDAKRGTAVTPAAAVN